MNRLLVLLLLIAGASYGQEVFLTPYKNLPSSGKDKVAHLTFSPDGSLIAAAGDKGEIIIRSVETGQVINRQPVKQKLVFLRYHPTLKRLITVTENGEIMYLEGDQGTLSSPGTFPFKTKLVNMDPTGQYLLALGASSIEIFDTRANMASGKIPFQQEVKKPLFMGYDRFGQQVSVITESGQVFTWNLLDQKLVRELKLQGREYSGSSSVLHAAGTNYGGDKFVVALQEVFIPKGGLDQLKAQPERRNLLIYYDWTTGMETRRIPVRYRPDQLSMGPQASHLSYFSKDNNSIWMVNYDQSAITSSLRLNTSPTATAFSPSNEYFAIGDPEGAISLYYVEKNATAEIKVHEPAIDRQYAGNTIRQQQVRVSGQVEGESRLTRVLVNSQPAELDFKGGFSASVPLNKGKNLIRIVAENSEQKTIVKDIYATCEPGNEPSVAPAKTGKRVALLIGNSTYAHAGKLNNTINDARLMETTLKSLGFETITITDGDYEKIKNAIFTFGDMIADASVSLFYYAGHGLEIDGTNYLVPVDADIQSALDVKQKSISLSGVLRTMEFANEEGLNMIILDACRNNPFPTGKRGGSGLTRVQAPSGTLIAYATDPGSTAADGTGKNGLYTGELAKQLSVQQRIEDVFMNTRNRVEELSKGAQRPWEEARLKGVFYLK